MKMVNFIKKDSKFKNKQNNNLYFLNLYHIVDIKNIGFFEHVILKNTIFGGKKYIVIFFING